MCQSRPAASELELSPAEAVCPGHPLFVGSPCPCQPDATAAECETASCDERFCESDPYLALTPPTDPLCFHKALQQLHAITVLNETVFE